MMIELTLQCFIRVEVRTVRGFWKMRRESERRERFLEEEEDNEFSTIRSNEAQNKSYMVHGLYRVR